MEQDYIKGYIRVANRIVCVVLKVTAENRVSEEADRGYTIQIMKNHG